VNVNGLGVLTGNGGPGTLTDDEDRVSFRIESGVDLFEPVERRGR
jgi:hypothetical protein